MLAPLSLRLSTSRNPARKISPCSVLSAGQKSSDLCAGAIHIISSAVPASRCMPPDPIPSLPMGRKVGSGAERKLSGGEQNGACESLTIVNATSGRL
jgi:hypothetical protein